MRFIQILVYEIRAHPVSTTGGDKLSVVPSDFALEALPAPLPGQEFGDASSGWSGIGWDFSSWP